MRIYLAIQYSGNEIESFKHANKFAGELMQEGHIVFSPISHTHPIAIECGLPGGWEYWKKFDESFIDWCDEVWIADFGNWQKSKGVVAEIEIAEKFNKKVKFVEQERKQLKLF